MSIVTISLGSYSRGREVAEKLAHDLGYEFLSREELLAETSTQFNIPEIKLAQAIHKAPTLFEKFHLGKEKFIAYIQHTLLNHLQKDNVVYLGLAGHFLLEGLPNVLRVRVIASVEDRIKEVMKQADTSEKQALAAIKKVDKERWKWSQNLYGKDPWAPELFDCILNIEKFSVEDAVKHIITMLKLPYFQTTDASKKILQEKLEACIVRTTLINKYPRAKTEYKDGAVQVAIEASAYHEQAAIAQVQEILDQAGIKTKVKVHITGDIKTE